MIQYPYVMNIGKDVVPDPRSAEYLSVTGHQLHSVMHSKASTIPAGVAYNCL